MVQPCKRCSTVPLANWSQHPTVKSLSIDFKTLRLPLIQNNEEVIQKSGSIERVQSNRRANELDVPISP